MSRSGEITQREFRNDSAAIMRGVERGESFTIARNKKSDGSIPLRAGPNVPGRRSWPHSPRTVGCHRLRANLDSISETNPFDREW